jgi:hypothetical protein
MNWYQPLEERIRCWRQWRQQLPQDLEASLLQIQSWWMQAPWRKNTKLTDDHLTWPTPWSLFDTHSYCDHMRALGMFYTLCLVPDLRKHGPELWIFYDDQGTRQVRAVLDQGKYALNASVDQIVNMSAVATEPETHQLSRYYPQDFKALL